MRPRRSRDRRAPSAARTRTWRGATSASRELSRRLPALADPPSRAEYGRTLEPGEPALGPARAGAPAAPSRNPVGRLFPGLPHGWRVTLDWILTIVGAVPIVLAIKQWVVNPYRIPSSSMEPTLHCAQPGKGLRGALLRPRARVPVHLPLPRSARGRHRRLQHAAGGERAVRRGRHVRQAADRPARRDVSWIGAARLRLHQRQEARSSRTSSKTGATRHGPDRSRVAPGARTS